MIAVIKTGGKQYLVKEGQLLTIEKLPAEKGAHTFSDVLLVSDGTKTAVGTPLVKGAAVKASIVGPAKGPRVTVVKYKAKVRYRRKIGHQQEYTKVKIESISGL